jgi:hypothetical protein
LGEPIGVPLSFVEAGTSCAKLHNVTDKNKEKIIITLFIPFTPPKEVRESIYFIFQTAKLLLFEETCKYNIAF